METLTPRTLEPGIRRVFGLLIVYWILYWLAITPVVWLTSGGPPVLSAAQYLALIALNGIALLLLVWPWMQHKLGSALLPIAVAICTLAFFIEKQWFLSLGNAPDVTPGQLMHAHMVRQDFILLLLLVAWQFRYRVAVVYTLAITVGEWVMVGIADLSNPLLSSITDRELVVRGLIFLLIAYIVNWLVERQRAQQIALMAANRAQADANTRLASYAATVEQLSASQERNRLARELHDTLAHSLSALSLQIEAVNSLWAVDDAAAHVMLEKAHATARDGLVEARRTLQALRATPLEAFGLKLALQALLESAAYRTGAQQQAHFPEAMPVLAAQTEQALYRIVQEALENSVRHAVPHNLSMYFEQNAKRYQLRIVDDGIGFDLAHRSPNGLGLRGMQERAAIFGGALSLTSAPMQGTVVTLTWGRHHE